MRSSTRINKWQLISNHFAIEKIYEKKEENFSNFAIILKKIDENFFWKFSIIEREKTWKHFFSDQKKALISILLR